MEWKEIKKPATDGWNEKLKSTNASFFQYPYYAAGYKYFLSSKAVFLELSNAGVGAGFCCIMQVGIYPVKIGLIIRGPVFFDAHTDITAALVALKEFARQKKYVFLRVNPNDTVVQQALHADTDFIEADYFPSYKGSQGKDLVVNYREEDELLKSFREDCRHKIRFQKEMPYVYGKVKTDAELKEVYTLFESLGKNKQFSYRPFKSYLVMLRAGEKHGLCSVYTVHLQEKLVCAAVIMKDGSSATYFSGALVLGDVKAKYSPANNLHYLIMQDCFYTEGKKIYNLSYSAPGSGVHMFKTSFKPEEKDKPPFYTYVIIRSWSDRILNMQKGGLKQVRNRLRKMVFIFKK